MFINTLWHDNVYDYDFLKLKNVLPLKIYLGLIFFKHLIKVKWSFEFFLNDKLLSIFLKKTIIKLLVYIYKNAQLCFNFIFIIFVI